MALFVKQNEPRNELQLKIAADLERRLKDQGVGTVQAPKTQPTILDDTEVSKGGGWIWLVVAGIGLIVAIIWATL